MTDWLERAMNLSNKPAKAGRSEPSETEFSKDKEAKAAVLEQQLAFSRRVIPVLRDVLEMLNQTFGDGRLEPVIEDHHKRMTSIKAELRSKPIVVNVLSMSSGRVRVSCYMGKEATATEEEFETYVTVETIRAWFGEALVRFFEEEG